MEGTDRRHHQKVLHQFESLVTANNSAKTLRTANNTAEGWRTFVSCVLPCNEVSGCF